MKTTIQVNCSPGKQRLAVFSCILAGLLIFSPGSFAQDEEQLEEEVSRSQLSQDVEQVKKSAIELNRDLLILEEELLFPSNTQLTIFLSLDVGYFFALDAVKISVDDKLVTSHLYTEKQNNALARGGVQKLWIGNVKRGQHEVTAILTGLGPEKREYKRGATVTIDKKDEPLMLELKIRDSTTKLQPKFEFEQWDL